MLSAEVCHGCPVQLTLILAEANLKLPSLFANPRGTGEESFDDTPPTPMVEGKQYDQMEGKQQ